MARMESGSARLLLVEDDLDNRDLTRELLEYAGHSVVAAANGAEALAALAEGHFALLVTDVGLPDINGVDLAREIRARQPGIGVILLTGYTLPASTLPDTEVLEKPVEPETLERVVQKVLARTSAASASRPSP